MVTKGRWGSRRVLAGGMVTKGRWGSRRVLAGGMVTKRRGRDGMHFNLCVMTYLGWDPIAQIKAQIKMACKHK